MIPIVQKDPEITEAILAAIRSKTSFVTSGANISGFHSAYKKAFLIQSNGSLIAAYDKLAEQWFVREDAFSPEHMAAKHMLADAVGTENLIAVPYKHIRQIQKEGYVSVVRKRLNVAKEK